MHNQLQMKAGNVPNIKTLNNVAVAYFQWGLQELSYQIWEQLYQEILTNPQNCHELLPVLNCNMGNMLRQSGHYEEASLMCQQGLKWCFAAGKTYAVPELIIQLAIIRLKTGDLDGARPLYSLGANLFQWSKQEETFYQSIEEMAEQDFLLYYQ